VEVPKRIFFLIDWDILDDRTSKIIDYQKCSEFRIPTFYSTKKITVLVVTMRLYKELTTQQIIFATI